jgi:hypothetical protein
MVDLRELGWVRGGMDWIRVAHVSSRMLRAARLIAA